MKQETKRDFNKLDVPLSFRVPQEIFKWSIEDRNFYIAINPKGDE